MKILLYGATGRLGKLVLEKALNNGHEVNVLARNISRIQNQSNLNKFEGDVLNELDIKKAIAGCDVVINTLNISRKSDFPWSKLRTHETFISDAMRKLIPIAKKSNIKRIITCSAWGTLETKKNTNWIFKFLIDYSNVGLAYKDHERQEKIIENSGINYTVVLPVILSKGVEEEIKETMDNTPKPSSSISRASVAKFIIDSLNRNDLINKKVVISNA